MFHWNSQNNLNWISSTLYKEMVLLIYHMYVIDLFYIWFYFPVNMKAELRKKYNISFDILDLKSFKRSAPNHGWAYIIFILKDGTTFPALHFHSGGSKALLQKFGKYIHIKRYLCWFIYPTHTLQRCRSRTSTEGDAPLGFIIVLICFLKFWLH